MVVGVITLWKGENSLVDVWVEFLAKRLKLDYVESLKSVVHNVRSHVHALKNVFEVHPEFFNIVNIFNLDLIHVLPSKIKVVSHIKKILCELRNGIFSGLVDFLLVALDCVIVFCDLIDELFLVLLDLLLQLLDLSILVCDKLLDFCNVLLGKRLGLAIALT